MPPPLVTILESLMDAAPAPVLSAAVVTVIIGGLVCLAASEDETTGAPAQQFLGLAVGCGLAIGLARTLAAILPALLTLG